jgi:HAD superfamily hydrolase (TIGR01509 family)
MVRAIIFDFDGVIADTEPLHHESFSAVLADFDVAVTGEEYYSRYLGLNDEAFLRTVCADRGRSIDGQTLRRMQSAKDRLYQARIAGGLPLLPGVEALVRAAAQRWPLAICSGARRAEIETILKKTGLIRLFDPIVSADEVSVSKPDPAGFRRTVELLRGRSPDLLASECLVIEDSLLGIRAAKSLGMNVLAVTGAAQHHTPTGRAECKRLADAARETLAGLTPEEVIRLF